MTLIDKKRAPRLRDQASLAASGVPCPYWYARAGIISAIEAAECAAIEASDARRDHKAKVQQLRSLKSVGEKFTSRTMEDLTKMVRAVKAIDAGVRLNPQALSSRVRGQGDELWDSFVESSNKFYDCVDRIEVACIPFEAILQRLLEIARETRLR